MKNTVDTFRCQKEGGDRITMLTCYDYSMARLMDGAGIDSLLVGDSLGMVMLGYPDTLSVTMEDMLHHTKAVARGAENALVVADMPFMSYQISPAQAVGNSGRFIKEGRAQAVKLEGGASVCAQIRAITEASIPVVAHIGLTPQSIHAFGGFKVQGKTKEAALALLRDALLVQDAGAFAVVLEAVPACVAEVITRRLSIPTIGIGAGAGCDGQVLVYQDMLGLYGELRPKFVKVFGDAGRVARDAFAAYIEETRSGVFPAEEHSFGADIDEDVLRAMESYSVVWEARGGTDPALTAERSMESYPVRD